MVSPEAVSRVLSQRTYALREKTWFESFVQNLPLVRQEPSAMSLDPIRSPAVVVGAGPSVNGFDFGLLKGFRGAVLTCDKTLIPLLKNGVVPRIVASLDGDSMVAGFYDDPLVDQHRGEVKACLATYVHPSAVRRVPFKRYWFNVIMGDDPTDSSKPSVTRAMHWMSNGKCMMMGLGNVGGWLWGLAVELKASPIILLGIDFSYGEELSPLNTPYWNGLLSLFKGDKKRTIAHCYRYETTPFGKRVLTDIVFDSYRATLMQAVKAVGVEVRNCSPYSIVHGEGVECVPWSILETSS